MSPKTSFTPGFGPAAASTRVGLDRAALGFTTIGIAAVFATRYCGGGAGSKETNAIDGTSRTCSSCGTRS